MKFLSNKLEHSVNALCIVEQQIYIAQHCKIKKQMVIFSFSLNNVEMVSLSCKFILYINFIYNTYKIYIIYINYIMYNRIYKECYIMYLYIVCYLMTKINSLTFS